MNEELCYKRQSINLGQNVLVKEFMYNGETIKVTGEVIEIYKHFALVKTNHYLTCINFI